MRAAARNDLRRKNLDSSDEWMVLQERIELSTSPLPSMCQRGVERRGDNRPSRKALDYQY